MNTTQITEKIIELLHERGITDADNGSQSLVDDLAMESLDRIELNIDCEKEFDITIDDSISERWKTVDDVAATVSSLIESANPPLV